MIMKCPTCDKEATATGKEWDYASFHVKQFKCSKDGRFMAYYKDGKLSHTIPKAK